jgi:hypothetical protein
MKVFAIIEGWIDDEYNLTLVPDPKGYTQEVVYAELDCELPTKFYEMYDLLEYWKPYNGKFYIDEVYGKKDEEGNFIEDDYSETLYWKTCTFEEGNIINTEYEEI